MKIGRLTAAQRKVREAKRKEKNRLHSIETAKNRKKLKKTIKRVVTGRSGAQESIEDAAEHQTKRSIKKKAGRTAAKYGGKLGKATRLAGKLAGGSVAAASEAIFPASVAAKQGIGKKFTSHKAKSLARYGKRSAYYGDK